MRVIQEVLRVLFFLAILYIGVRFMGNVHTIAENIRKKKSGSE